MGTSANGLESFVVRSHKVPCHPSFIQGVDLDEYSFAEIARKRAEKGLNNVGGEVFQ